MISLLKLTSLCAMFLAGVFLTPSVSQAGTITHENQTWTSSGETGKLVPHLSVLNDTPLFNIAKETFEITPKGSSVPLLSTKDLPTILKIASELKQSVIEPEITLRNNRAVKFEPGQNGQVVDLYLLRKLMLSSNTKFEVPLVITKPQKQLSDLNNLGINELVAVGESNFVGSPRNRVHNIAVGAEKFDGIIVAPGEEFSFNKHLGDVDAENGFLPELVIKSGTLIPEFGGGLCQVSSTTFRAAMNAGLPISARKNHSFAVQYYAPQGTDATIYPGAVDFKFVNNLSSHLLMRTRMENSKLYFEFYGTKDNREVAFEGPIQYDKKSDGSMKATWTRHVTSNGSVTTQTFNSTYQPPALFQRVTTEQESTPNPQAENPAPIETEEEPVPEPTT